MSDLGLTIDDLQGSNRRLRTERVMRSLFFGAALVSILISSLIVFSLVREAWAFVTSVELGKLFDEGWFPRRDMFDVRTILVGSLLVTVVAMVVAVPVGLGAAVFMSEYASPRLRKVLKPILEVLAGVPSVVLGFFALTVISPSVTQPFFGTSQFNMLAAGIAVGVLTIPLVASVSEDALRSVPQALREASYGMGARKITTSIRVVIPAAISGLVAAMVLAVSRAIGETMVVAIAAGATGGSLFEADVREKGQTMTAAMAALAAGTDQVKGSSNAFQSLFFVGLILFAITLTLNIAAGRFVRRFRQKY
jgi:phosphate transport system permease protein